MFWIPVISPLLEALSVEDHYEIFCIVSAVLAIVSFLFFLRHPLRLGKLYKPGTARLGIELSDVVAGTLVNLWALLAFSYTGQFLIEFRSQTFQAMAYSIVHLYRSVSHSFFRSSYSSPWPLESFLFVFVQKSIIAVLSARIFVNGLPYMSEETPFSFVCYALFFVFFALQIWFDVQLGRLRVKGDRGYKIPVGFVFNYVSCPSYVCEALMWVVWGLTFSMDFGIFAVWTWLVPMVWLRAEQTHVWYHRVFKGAYPRRRRAFFPFVDLWSPTLPLDI
jgi:hypothetical protein